MIALAHIKQQLDLSIQRQLGDGLIHVRTQLSITLF
jgi:hypothetical protein